MNMYLHELKAYRKSTVIWTVSMIGLVVMFMSMYPSIAKDAADFKKLLEGFPESVRKAVGLEVDSVTSLLGFYSYIFLYIVLCGAIQATYLGISIFSKETREKTADFLFTKPVTRSQVMTAKVLAALTSLALTSLLYLAAASIMVSLVKTDSFSVKVFMLISITLFFLQLLFLALGVVISVVMTKIKSVLSVSLGVVFTFFIIAMLSSVSGDDVLRYLTPFKYFDSAYILKHSSYHLTFVIISIGIFIVANGVSYLVYAKKDIHVA